MHKTYNGGEIYVTTEHCSPSFTIYRGYYKKGDVSSTSIREACSTRRIFWRMPEEEYSRLKVKAVNSLISEGERFIDGIIESYEDNEL